MMPTRLFLPFALLGLVVSVPLHGADAKYLPAGQPDALTLLAPPAAPGSPEDQADADTAFRVYSAGTAEQREVAKSESKLTIFHFAPEIGPWFQAGKFPKTEALFKEIEAEAKTVVNNGKDHWQRQRPYNADPARFPGAVEHEGRTSYSYPSGHSTRGTVFAGVLAEIFPEQRDAIFVKGRQIGWYRVIGGVHYPADIYAGRVLGQAIVRELLASPDFQRDLAAAKAEIAAAHPEPVPATAH